MKKVEDFTDQELEQQIEMLQGMDVMGSQKLLKSFLEEKERRETERAAAEEAKKAEEEKRKEEFNQKRGAQAKTVIDAVNNLYDKCYIAHKNGFTKYYHVRGVIDNEVYVDTVYKYAYKNSHASSVVTRHVSLDEFKKEIEGAEEIPFSEFIDNRKTEFYSNGTIVDKFNKLFDLADSFGFTDWRGWI